MRSIWSTSRGRSGEDVYLMRNRVAHGYFSVDLEIVWRTVQRDLPVLERDVLRLRRETGG